MHRPVFELHNTLPFMNLKTDPLLLLTARLKWQMNNPQLEVGETSRLVADLGLDSLDLVEIVSYVEDSFDLTIPDTEWDKIKTVGDILGLIQRQ